MAHFVQNLPFPILLAAILPFLLVDQVASEGGIAEMKALTGDAPYLGGGNHAQAPEYFGDAVYRQYYKDAAGAPSGRGRFAYNAMNSGMGYGGIGYNGVGYGNGPYGAAGYRMPYRGYGQTVDNYGNYGNYRDPTFPRGNAGAGGYYAGRGNDWA